MRNEQSGQPDLFAARDCLRADPRAVLKSVFGYDSFRPLQEEIISNVLDKRDTLAVMPTGGGKSLCYEIPALVFPGLTVVVSPLIALMQDQVAQLEAAGVKAVLLNSALEREAYRSNMDLVRSGEARLLYLAPESLVTDRVRNLLSSVRVDCLTIDEAHCISEWGHDFRPEYRQIAGIRSSFPGAVCLALTATATAQVRRDIKKNLGMDKPAEFVASFNRQNIYLEVARKRNPVQQTLDFLAARPEDSGIVYCFSRKQVDSLVSELSARGVSALPYHAGLADEVRAANQEKFLRDEARVMVATVAFGMGINKPNVGFVIHFDLPKSLEQYYQEIGRAGRDGRQAHALLLYGRGDTRKIRFFMEEKSAGETRKAETHLKAMTDYAESHTCRRAALLAWFGEAYAPAIAEGPDGADPSVACDPADRFARGVCPEGQTPSASLSRPVGRDKHAPCCDICDRGPVPERDMTVPVQKYFSCVLRTGERFGAAYVADVLVGSKQKRILENGHNKLSTWGIGGELSREDWIELAGLLVDEGYLSKDSEYGVLSLAPLAREVLSGREAIMLPFEPVSETAGAGGAGSGSAAGRGVAGGKRTLAFPKKTGGIEPDDREGMRILSSLKTLRRGLAEAAAVPPYVIFSDRTLEDIAVKKPATRAALLDVYGIGGVKAEKYGEFIMKAVKQAE